MLEGNLASQTALISTPPSQDGTMSEGLSCLPQRRKPGRKPKLKLPPEPIGGRKVTPLLGESGLKVRKTLRAELMKRGVEEKYLPPPLQDVEVARSKKGKSGQIVVRALSGVSNSPATALARRLENDFSNG